ncbi:MAG: DNA mismatch repair endonuclease MutL [Asgard group archaeon]|nr:DNA mismatch repair endonuclease MutL [Asgard group archaeon]
MSKKIRTIVQLDKKTINKIAAGEVVERPASVVKELIENSIDADATAITIIIKDYGLDEIRITDNGIGMTREDASLAWKSHTTSKLKKIEDLEDIVSLGFRGEALASIASVSMMEIITRTKNQKTGTIVRIKGGDLELIDESESAIGTTISIKNLFYNVPARKKFLKTKSTEIGHIIEIVTRYALIRPDIHFKLQHNNKMIVNSPKSSNPLDPFIAIFGIDDAKLMIPINYKQDDVSIDGFISRPELTKASRDFEIYYVNKRYVKSRIISDAIESAYSTLVMKHRYPVTLLSITIDSSKIDVNIHPTKREIRFDDVELISSIITDAITQTFTSQNLWRDAKILLKDSVQSSLQFDPIDGETILTSSTDDPVVPIEKIATTEDGQIKLISDSELIVKTQEGAIDTSVSYEKRVVKFTNGFWLRPLGQAMALYALCESSEGVAIVDIHAAHERIRYEELVRKYTDSKIDQQQLLQPISITLNPEQIAFIKSNLEQFREIGMNFELFGGNTFILRQIPVIMDLAQTEQDIKDLIDEIREEIPNIKNLNERIDLMLKKIACHSVVRGGDLITLNKIVTILINLTSCQKPFTCPHGRPTIIKISQKTLEKEFERIV